MPQWLSHRQALELIAYISNAEFDSDNKNKALSDIYTIAHSSIASKTCFFVHKDWRNKWGKVYQKLKEDNQL